jgi:hypothetical protein
MGAARSARSRRWSDPRWLGAAAAAVLVLAVGGLMAISGSGDPDDSETASMDAAEEPTTSAGGQADGSAPDAGTGSDESGGAGSATEEGGSPAAPDQMSPNSDASASASAGVVDLGDAGDRDELADRVGVALDESGARTTRSPSAADDGDESGGESSQGPPAEVLGDCEDPLAGRTAGPLVMTGRGTLEGEPVTVWVHEDRDAHRMVAVDRSCSVVAEGVVPG